MEKINKKSQSLSINVIIVAALALIVLVVLSALFTGKVRIFSQNLEDCYSKQGDCKSDCGPNEAKITNARCPKEKPQVCCVPVFSK